MRFVRFKHPLAEILGEREDEEQKQEAAEHLRDLILRTKSNYSTDQLRILVKKQSELWNEGIALGEMFARQKALNAALDDRDSDDDGDKEAEEGSTKPKEQVKLHESGYAGGKWGRYLRAPDFYFDIMREFGSKFVRLGDIASVRFGIKSGCDAFFMPRDISRRMLEDYGSEVEWQHAAFIRRPKRSEVASGKVLIIEAGDKTLHPIERKFVRPELHSLMKVDRPVVRPEELDRVVLWVSEPLEELKGTYACEYIKWGSKQTFASKKSKAVPVPKRPTCAQRPVWYDLTGLEAGAAFWPMTHKYRHIIPGNPRRIPCNHRLFDVHPMELDTLHESALVALLNSTIVGLFKHFYGRYAGTEGTLDTEVFEASMVELPDVRLANQEVCRALITSLQRMAERPITHMVEQSLLDCHTEAEMREIQRHPLGRAIELQQPDRRELDLAVFELLGVNDRKRRDELVERLYSETTLYHREQRIQDIQASINRTQSRGMKDASQIELALDAWEHLDFEWRKPLPEWLKEKTGGAKTVELPDGDVRLPRPENFLEANTLFFGKKPGRAHECASRSEAELLYQVAHEGLRGPVSIPSTEAECTKLLKELEFRLIEGRRKLIQLAEERAGTDKLREQVVETLHRWFILGKPEPFKAANATTV